jgi:hypothetical protein
MSTTVPSAPFSVRIGTRALPNDRYAVAVTTVARSKAIKSKSFRDLGPSHLRLMPSLPQFRWRFGEPVIESV